MRDSGGPGCSALNHSEAEAEGGLRARQSELCAPALRGLRGLCGLRGLPRVRWQGHNILDGGKFNEDISVLNTRKQLREPLVEWLSKRLGPWTSDIQAGLQSGCGC